jgi:hypothetical protein
VPNKTRQIKGWDTFQHYKTGPHAKNAPEWIKLYPRLLNDMEWYKLTDTDKAVLTELWMLASEKGGCLPQLEEIAFRLRRPVDQITMVLNRLPNWIENAAVSEPSRQPLDDIYTPSSPEEKRIQDTREKRIELEGAEKAPTPSKRAHRLKEDWQPRKEDFDQLSSEGFSFSEIEDQLLRFRDYWKGNGRAMVDWSATFRNWVRKSAELGSRGQGPPRTNTKISPFMEAGKELIEEFSARDEKSGIELKPHKRITG